jgi:RNA polymerase sigma-70 factor (ECF subfamily)
MMELLSGPPGLEDTPIGRLYQRHWLALLTTIRQRINSREDAEDIVLDVFLAALESSTLLSMSEPYQEAWLRRVAYHKCMDFHRRANRHPTFPLEAHVETLYDDELLAPEPAALRQEELEQLQQHLAALSSDQQEILRLRFADGLPCAQIAARMLKSEGAIRTMLSRALNLLRGSYIKREASYHD